MNADELLVRESIRDLVGRYNSAVDRGAYEELARIFTPDGVLSFGGETGFDGCREIVSALRQAADRRGAFAAGNFQRHIIGNSIIHVDGERSARSIHYALVVSELGVDHFGLYRDDFVALDGRWLIRRRLANLEWVRPDSRFAQYPRPVATPPSVLDIWTSSGEGLNA